MKRVILDIEIYKYDILIGLYDIDNNTFHYYWNKDIYNILEDLKTHFIITFNGNHYDLPIIYQYFYNKNNKYNYYELSKHIVEEHLIYTFPMNFFDTVDVMSMLSEPIGLKKIEAMLGWEIRETTISFDYQYKLTREQQLEIEHYNNQDLLATYELFKKLNYYFTCRISLANYLKIEHNYFTPLPTLMGRGLGAHRQLHSDFLIHEKCFNIPLKHFIKQVMLEQMKKPNMLFKENIIIGDREYTVSNGGLHSTVKSINTYDVVHVDVKGYYSLLMMDFELFSRNLPKKGKELYRHMYFERLKLKHSNPILSDSLKLGILSVWGATKNKFHILYDKDVGNLIPLYGQLFLLYLIELFSENNINILNANTDGLIVKGDIDIINKIVKQWQEYHNFDVEIVTYKRFIQKDVNNYIIANSFEDIKVKGRDFTAIRRDWIFSNIILVPQAPVIAKILSELLYKNIQEPEEYIDKIIKNYEVKDYMFIISHSSKYEGMRYIETGKEIQKVNRVYAHKEGYNIEKFKDDKVIKYPGLPLVKICNENLKNVDKNELDINYEFYKYEIIKKWIEYVKENNL